MPERTRRRELLKNVAAAAAGSAAIAAAAPADRVNKRHASVPDGHQGLSAYAFGSRVWVRVGGRVFTCYRAEPNQKYPYFYPVIGPGTGLPMTDEAALPYRHHRSLFFGCDHVNGGNYWQQPLTRGRIASQGPGIEKESNEKRVTIADRCLWKRPDREPVIEDTRRFAFTVPSRDQRFIDADITLIAKVDVHITRTNHSFFSLRAARDLAPIGGGKLLNAEGASGEKATAGVESAWCGYQGRRLGITESIVLMDHPANPFSPCKWFTRDYGFISPTPFYWLDENGWHLPQGDSIRLRYRVVATNGPIDKGGLARIHTAWSAAT